MSCSWLGSTVALLTSVCMYLSYEEEKKKSQGQVNVPESFKRPTKSIYMLHRLIL